MSREMKDSGVEWIGEIPEDWDVKRIKHAVVQMGSGTTPNSDNSNFYDGNIAWIQSGDLYNTPIITKTSKTVTEQAIQRCSALKIYHKPYIVIAMYGASVGNVSIASIDACTNQACCIIKPNDNNNIDYLKYWLEVCKTDFIRKSVGGGQPNISQDKVREQTYLCPSPTEQQQIVHFLDRKCTAIDAAIEKTKKSIEKLEEYKKAVITKAVTKGINPNAKMKDSGVEWIGEISEGMDIIRIKFISDIFGRIGFQGYTQDDLVNEGDGAISLSPSNLKSFRMSYDKCTYISWPKYEESPEIKIENGDILFVKTGSSYGKSCIVKNLPEKATINPQLIVFKNIKCNNKYLFYLLQTWIVDTQTQWYVTGGTIPTMSQDKIANFYLPYYKDNYKQQQIVHFLDRKCTTIDTAIEKKKKAIEKWEEYKKSLIYYAVTGKIDCRNEVI